MVQQEIKRVMRTSNLASIERKELISCAWLGLYEAKQRFDPRQGVSFSSYARLRIRGAIFDGLAETSALGKRGVRMVKRQLKATHRPNHIHHVTPKNSQGIRPTQGCEYAAYSTSHQSLVEEGRQTQSFVEGYRQLCAHMENVFWSDRISEVTLDPWVAAQEEEELQLMVELMSEAFKQLDNKEQDLLVATFDLRGVGDNAMRYANRLGVHRSTIARRQATILMKLKNWMVVHRQQKLKLLFA